MPGPVQPRAGHDQCGFGQMGQKELTMGKREVVVEQPRYIKLNARDNVAIVVNDFGLPAPSRFSRRAP